jgi:hypothetical protein
MDDGIFLTILGIVAVVLIAALIWFKCHTKALSIPNDTERFTSRGFGNSQHHTSKALENLHGEWPYAIVCSGWWFEEFLLDHSLECLKLIQSDAGKFFVVSSISEEEEYTKIWDWAICQNDRNKYKMNFRIDTDNKRKFFLTLTQVRKPDIF